MKGRSLLTILTAVLLVLAATGGARAQDEEKKVKLKGHELALPEPVRFKPGTDKLEKGGEASLRLVADFLKEKKLITLLRVEGHVNGGADKKATQALSERRALTVARWLTAQGVDCKRLVAVGFGDTKPLGNDSAANERVTFVNAALAGRLIGGMPADGGGKVAGETCQQ